MRRCRALGLAALVVAAGASAEPVPIDPWADRDWELALSGLRREAVRSLQHVEEALMPAAGAAQVVSTREATILFDDEGRVQRLELRVERRGERRSAQALSYAWSGGRLLRIDEDGADRPFLQREYDAAGRLRLERRRTGAVERRVEFGYDVAGREVSRVTEDPSFRQRVTRRYHANGQPKSEVSDGGFVRGKRAVSFDTDGRPTEIVDTDLSSRIVTTIRYPSPLVAVRRTSGVALTKDGVRSPDREVTLRVRRAEELASVEEPAAPLARRESVGGRVEEVQTDVDDAGRPREQRRLDGDGRIGCVTMFRYHASGLLENAQSRRPGSDQRCAGDTQDVEFEIDVDERGAWNRLHVYLVGADGTRRLAQEQRRVVKYR